MEDQRWRPAREPELPPQDQRERSSRAMIDQCLSSRMPGYTGFIPSARAEDVYGRTQAAVGRTVVEEQQRRHMQKPPSPAALGTRTSTRPGTGLTQGAEAPADHPLGKSQACMVRNHWVPTIPGYGGYVPGKHAENICGGGIIHTCKMAGRAIAERTPMSDPLPPVAMEDYHGQNLTDGPERERLARDIRMHCAKQIPGYMGFVPRIKGESIYGTTARQANLLAADFCEDRIYNPENHGPSCCGPQKPKPLRLRI